MSEVSAPHCSVVAIIGAPNAGKSTLVNRLVGSKVAAVTQKVQTTRAVLRGVAMRGQTQLVLIDTPGVFAPRRRLDRAMVSAAWGALQGADEIVHLVDASAHAEGGPGTRGNARDVEDSRAIAERLKKTERPSVLALNKIDATSRPALLEITARLTGEGLYTDVFMISSRNGDGVEDLAGTLSARAPEGPWLFPEDQIADAPMAVLAAEITREKAMLRLHDEIPYELTVRPEQWEERKDGSVRIEQNILVARESQRKIAIGAKGASVKAIGESARLEMEAAFGRRVHLFLHVKVKENWAEDREFLTVLGLDSDS